MCMDVEFTKTRVINSMVVLYALVYSVLEVVIHFTRHTTNDLIMVCVVENVVYQASHAWCNTSARIWPNLDFLCSALCLFPLEQLLFVEYDDPLYATRHAKDTFIRLALQDLFTVATQ